MGYFDQANPHALASITRASESSSIVASQDIFDAQGVKLWARNQPVSYALQQRLLERKLRQPMEACLQALDGVSVVNLRDGLERMIDTHPRFGPAFKPRANDLLAHTGQLPLHSVAQLLLTSMKADRPESLDHAIAAMALSGALSLGSGASPYEVRLSMLAGLLHDIGEIYVDPRYFEFDADDEALDGPAFRHMVVHPRIAQVLLGSLTDYPEAVSRAILEHHERLDGSGYPQRTAAAGLSSGGRMLAVVDACLGILRRPHYNWAHASFALRMVPGEFDAAWVKFIVALAHEQDEAMLQEPGAQELDVLAARLSQLDGALQAGNDHASRLAHAVGSSPVVRDVARQAQHLLAQLRTGWNAMGLWQADTDSPLARFELGAAVREFGFRLRCVRRQCLWPLNELSDEARRQLDPLWGALRGADAAPSPV